MAVCVLVKYTNRQCANSSTRFALILFFYHLLVADNAVTLENPHIMNSCQNLDITNPDMNNLDVTNSVITNPGITNHIITKPDVKNPDKTKVATKLFKVAT